MNDLTMGPLPAKVKRELDDRGRPFWVVRCGVRDCPEKLGQYTWLEGDKRGNWSFVGYVLSNGVWIKTRRNGIRSLENRERTKEFIEYEAAMKALEQEEKTGVCSPWHYELQRREMKETQRRIRRRMKELPKHFGSDYSVAREELTEWPLILKCARCGRLSKIEKAD
jgi:hypothetical protein